MRDKAPTSVVVIGAGLSGLAAAWKLVKAGLKVTVLEALPRVGGRVFTDSHAGVEIDAGAQFIANFYTHTLSLIRELGLAGDVVRIPGAAAILRDGRLHGMWPDLRLPFTGLISLWSKLLLLKPALIALRHWGSLDIHAFYKTHHLDTRSVAAYSLQELNEEVLEYVLQPPLSGIFYWTPEHTSQAMLFPLIKAAIGVRLLTLRHGLGELAGALAARLDIELNTRVTRVTPNGAGRFVIQAMRSGSERTLTARGVVCTVPAPLVQGIIPDLTPEQRSFFKAIGYSANAIAAIGMDRRLPPDFYGLLTPRQEVRRLAIAAVQSVKNPQQLPAGRDLLVLYPSGPAGRRLIGKEDGQIREALLQDLEAVGNGYLPGTDETFCRVYRWPEALPKFDVGHLQRLNAFAHGKIEKGRLVFAGDYLGGPFVEGAINSGLEAAGRLLAELENHQGDG